MEKKMSTSATNEFGKHPSKKVRAELLENNNETNKLVVGLWKHLNTWGEILPLTKNNCLFEIKEETKTSFTEKDMEKAWINDKHHK